MQDPPSASLQPTDCSRHVASNSRLTPLIPQDRTDSIPTGFSICSLLHSGATQITVLILQTRTYQRLEIPLAATKQMVLPAAHSVSRESRQQADSTADFIMAARGLPLVPPGLIYAPSAAEGQRLRRWLGGRDAWQLHPHQPSACRSSCPPGSGRRRQRGRHSGKGKWPTALRVSAV